MLEPERGTRAGGLLSLWAALGLVLACATPGLPPAEPASKISVKAVQRVQDLYLYQEHLDRRFLVGALDALERTFEAVRFEEGKNDGVLWVGSERARVPLDETLDPEGFQKILGRVLAFIGPGVREELEKNEELDPEVIALRGALRALDRYSTVFAGRGTEDFRIHFSGKLRGIGARVGRRDGQLRAIKVFSDSPAEKGGLQDGDALISIDGEPTQPLSVKEAVGKIRGKAGSTIVLGIERDEKQLDIKIVRGEVVIPTVEGRPLDNGIGYLRIRHMSRATVKECRDMLEELGEIEGLVLDLRGNSGGSMRTSTALADFFLKKGTILRVVDRKDPTSSNRRNRSVATRKVVVGVPTIVLIDRVTASGAEILAGAIAPLPRVQLVGQRTFGKGLIQRVFPLPEDHLLKLTVGEYILSDDRAIHAKGIDPDLFLFPISRERMTPLSNVPAESVPYLLPAEEEDTEEGADDDDGDTFPIEVAQALLAEEPEEPLSLIRAKADAEIAEQLSELGITWTSEKGDLPEPLPKAIRIDGSAHRLIAGQPGTLRLKVKNPNDFTIPDAWVAIQAPAKYVSDELLSLGDLAPGEIITREIKLTPPYGLSVPRQPVTVHVASGSRPLQSQRLVLEITQQPPQLEIEVTRIGADRIEVTLQQHAGMVVHDVRISVPGAFVDIDDLAPAAAETRELQLSGEATVMSVTLRGPGMRRQIDVPIPDEHVVVVPPSVDFEKGGLPGRPKLLLNASSSEGLEVGLIFLDGQKEIYVDWQGEQDGQLQTSLANGEHSVTSRVESVSGVAVTDSWKLTAN